MNERIVSAHQPNFLPWLGFFDRMERADLFVLVDHVQFERQNYQNRTRVKTGAGPRWLTVPVFQRSQEERIVEKLIDNQRDGKLRWGRKLFLTLKYSYQAAPYFDRYAPEIQRILDRRWERLIDLNLELLDFCRRELGIVTPLVRSSSLPIQGAKSDMVLDLCRSVGANAYIAGLGGCHDYLDVEAFKEAGIRIIWQDFSHPRYRQEPGHQQFVPGLSVLDLLFNCGPNSRAILKSRNGAAVHV